jgi:glycerate kinase
LNKYRADSMRVLAAADSYKGSLNVAACMEKGIVEVLPQGTVIKLPLSDGGEGTVDAIVNTRKQATYTYVVFYETKS